MVAETKKVKEEFNALFQDIEFKTVGYFGWVKSEYDFVWDLNTDYLPVKNNSFDAILCQATFEHLLNPFGALMNFRNVLKEDGYILLHTVLVDSEHPYHPAPRDYLRFWFDWFYDVQYYLQITLQDYKIVNGHVFLCIGTIMMRNRVKCLECGKVLESLHMKDYQECNCSNHAYTSGGTHYRRCGAMRPSSLAIVEEDDSIRKYKSEIDYKK